MCDPLRRSIRLEFLFEYGLFLAKSVTILAAILIVIIVIVGASQRNRDPESGTIEVKNLNESLAQISQSLKSVVLNPDAKKQDSKDEKKKLKEKHKSQKQHAKEGVPDRDRVYVIDFKGDVQASEVANLREEITAVLSVAAENDEVLVRVESPGGVVHGYGLAASQLQRVRTKGITLTVAVDKVAASGGYMMACVGDKIIAAPFAIVGSIGVVAQMPNFNKLLKKHDIDFELLTAGEHKRTLTLFGKNTDKGREKFIEELNETHELFKEYVSKRRPNVDINKIASGEIWFGSRAKELSLVDEISTSDEYICSCFNSAKVFEIKFVRKQKLLQRVGGSVEASITRIAEKLWSRFTNPNNNF